MVAWLIYVGMVVAGFSLYLLFTQPQNFFHYAEIVIVALGRILILLFTGIFKILEALVKFIMRLFKR